MLTCVFLVLMNAAEAKKTMACDSSSDDFYSAASVEVRNSPEMALENSEPRENQIIHTEPSTDNTFSCIGRYISNFVEFGRKSLIRFLRFLLGLLEPRSLIDTPTSEMNESSKKSFDSLSPKYVSAFLPNQCLSFTSEEASPREAQTIPIKVDSFDSFHASYEDQLDTDVIEEGAEEHQYMSDSEIHNNSGNSSMLGSSDLLGFEEGKASGNLMRRKRRKSATCLGGSTSSPKASPRRKYDGLGAQHSRTGKNGQSRDRKSDAKASIPHYAEPTIASLNARSPRAKHRTPEIPRRTPENLHVSQSRRTPQLPKKKMNPEEPRSSEAKNRRYKSHVHKALEKKQAERSKYVKELSH